MEVFAVFRQGVYRHECGGIFSTREAAIECADALVLSDNDSWHDYEVVPFALDVRCEVGTATFHSPPINEPDAIYSNTKPRK